MLKGIPSILTPELLKILMEMGHGDELLICDGIGNCMKDLLGTMGIKVLPGVRGGIGEVIALYRAGKLAAGEKYSCADHGRTCGERPGSF